MAVEIGLIDILKSNIKGKRYGIENWKYFLLAIINRIDNSTSKERMGIWTEKTILPELLTGVRHKIYTTENQKYDRFMLKIMKL